MPTTLLRRFTFLLALCAAPLSATEFCVSNVAQLQGALTVATTNGQTDTIRIVAGTLAGASVFYSTEAYGIRVSGGYNAGCSQAVGQATVLDGNGIGRPLRIYNTNGNIEVERITFTNGLSTNDRGGGLNVQSSSGDIRIEFNRFLGNRADDRAGALNASTTTGQLTIRNNLFYANSAAVGGAVELFQNGDFAFVISNTIYANEADSGAPNSGGLNLTGTASYGLYNNIIWGNTANGALDIHVYATVQHARLANDIGSVGGPGATPFLLQGEQDVAPGFAPCRSLCLGFELQRGSPLVDVGIDEPFGDLSATDLAGKPRIIGPHVDIGAYENERLFADGFD